MPYRLPHLQLRMDVKTSLVMARPLAAAFQPHPSPPLPLALFNLGIALPLGACSYRAYTARHLRNRVSQLPQNNPFQDRPGLPAIKGMTPHAEYEDSVAQICSRAPPESQGNFPLALPVFREQS